MRFIPLKGGPARPRAHTIRLWISLLLATVCLPALAAPAVRASVPGVLRLGPKIVKAATRMDAMALAAGGSLAWDTSVTSLPTPLVYPAVATGQDGTIYVFGGANPARASDITYIYHPNTNSWSQGASMPIAREAAQAVTLPDGRMIVMGGTPDCGSSQYGCVVYNSVDIYDPRTDTWTAAAPMQTARERFTAVLGNDGLVYAMGGWDGNHALASVEIYNSDSNSWSYGPSLPQAEEGPAAVVDPNGHIMVLGGFDGHSEDPATATYYNSVYIFTGNGWSSGASMPFPSEDLAAVRGADGRIYAIGGFKNDGWEATVQVYDPSSDAWSSVAPLPPDTYPVRCCLGAVTVPDGRIFTFGGDGPTAQVDVYGPIPSPSPVVGLVPSSLDFGDQDANVASGSKSAYVINAGTLPLAINSVTITGPNASDFGETDTCTGATVSPNDGCGIYVSFKPAGAGPRTASVTISDSAANSPQSIALSGSGRVPLSPSPSPSPSPASTGWALDAPLPSERMRPAVTTGQDGNIYVFGGMDESQPGTQVTNTTYIYRPAGGTWSQGANMPTAREGARAVTLPDGRIAVLGGGIRSNGSGCQTEQCQDGTVLDTVEVYDPHLDTWQTLAPMQSPRYRFAAVLYHGRVYAIGGTDGEHVLNSVEAYDPAANSWSYVAGLPQAEEAPAAAVDSNDHIDVVGGFDGAGYAPTYYNNLFIYDGNGWTSGAPMPTARQDLGATRGADGRIYAVGGFAGNGWVAAVEAYAPGSNGWSSAAALPSAECCMGVTTAPDGHIYAIGGNHYAANGDGSLTRVLSYAPSTSMSPTTTATPTNTPVDDTATATPASTDTPTLSPTATSTLAPTTTSTLTPSTTPTDTPAPSATGTPSPVPTNTPVAPTETAITAPDLSTATPTPTSPGVGSAAIAAPTPLVRTVVVTHKVVVTHTVVRVVRVPVPVVVTTQRRVSGDSALPVRVRAVPHAQLSATLQVAKKRLASITGQTNAKGLFSGRLRVAYNPKKPTHALMRVQLRATVHKRLATAVRTTQVLIVPRQAPHQRQKRTGHARQSKS